MKLPLAAAGVFALIASTGMPAIVGDARAGDARPGQTELAAGAQDTPTSQAQEGEGKAEKATDAKDEKVIERITREENTRVGPSGATEPSTGGAEPVENWFGCPPDDGKEAAPVEKNRESCNELGGGVTE